MRSTLVCRALAALVIQYKLLCVQGVGPGASLVAAAYMHTVDNLVPIASSNCRCVFTTCSHTLVAGLGMIFTFYLNFKYIRYIIILSTILRTLVKKM